MTEHEKECELRFEKVMANVGRLEKLVMDEIHKLTDRLDELDARTHGSDDDTA